MRGPIQHGKCRAEAETTANTCAALELRRPSRADESERVLEFPKVEVAGSNPVPRSPKSSPISGRMFQPGAVLGVLIARPGPTLGPISFFSARAAEPNFF